MAALAPESRSGRLRTGAAPFSSSLAPEQEVGARGGAREAHQHHLVGRFVEGGEPPHFVRFCRASSTRVRSWPRSRAP